MFDFKKISLMMSLMASFYPCVMSAAVPSGTLPVMYISTENGAAIEDKETYVAATCYIDAGKTGFESLGTIDNPISLGIKGRGNYTWWGFDKKPYKLKFDKKRSLFGMPDSKHYAILAHADDEFGYLKNETGFNLSRMINLAWTPDTEPVEVCLNGEYIGLYFLTETIRVEKTRVNISEMEDEATADVTGGWLVEIDNYDSDPHISITEGNSNRIIFTYKSPEKLSEEQESFLINQMESLNRAIYGSDKKDSSMLMKLLDLESAAKYYIVQEIMDDCESYHGSCYLYRDAGSDEKWHFGPVWDFGNSFARKEKNFVYIDPSFSQTWIGELAKFPVFQELVEKEWSGFVNQHSDNLFADIDETVEKIKQASLANDEVWPQYATGDIDARSSDFRSLIAKSMRWLGERWGTSVATPEHIYLRGDDNDWSTSQPFIYAGKGIYRLDNVTLTKPFKIATSDWTTIDLGATGDNAFSDSKAYTLTEKGGNIPLEKDLHDITLYVDMNNKTVFTGNVSSGVESLKPTGGEIDICGNVVVSDMETVVYNVSGIIVGKGERIEIASPGIYIAVNANGSRKLILD